MTDLITPTDRDRIAAAIRTAELRTSGEILVLVARSASDYWAIPILWAAILAFAAPWPLIWFTNVSAHAIYIIQLAAFIILAAIFSLPRRNRMRLVPRFLRRRRARQMAREHFFTQGLHRTAQRTGVMIFVAAGERYAEILVDDGIAACVEHTVWRGVVTDLVASLRDNRMADGLVQAVEACAPLLAQHAPLTADDQNELPDKVVLL